MFANKKKQREILAKDNIVISHEIFDVSSAIEKVGDMLLRDDYIELPYIEAMHKRNASLSVFLGNYLAVPHGEYEAKKYIKASGISVLVLPDGMDWDGNRVHFVIGLAGKDQEHIKILSNIAELFQEEDKVLELVKATSTDKIYDALSKGGL